LEFILRKIVIVFFVLTKMAVITIDNFKTFVLLPDGGLVFNEVASQTSPARQLQLSKKQAKKLKMKAPEIAQSIKDMVEVDETGLNVSDVLVKSSN